MGKLMAAVVSFVMLISKKLQRGMKTTNLCSLLCSDEADAGSTRPSREKVDWKVFNNSLSDLHKR